MSACCRAVNLLRCWAVKLSWSLATIMIVYCVRFASASICGVAAILSRKLQYGSEGHLQCAFCDAKHKFLWDKLLWVAL